MSFTTRCTICSPAARRTGTVRGTPPAGSVGAVRGRPPTRGTGPGRDTPGGRDTLLGRAATLAVLIGLSLPQAVPAQSASSHRDEWQRPGAVLAALEAAPGSRIADVGAGAGYFTTRLSAAVGPEGRVFAVDISESTLNRLRHDLEREGIRNVEIVLGETDDPRLPYGTLDGALIVNAYHEMTEYRAMLAGVRRALRPGGRLVIVDNPPGDSARDREAQMERHHLAIEIVEEDLREAGFEVTTREPRFIDEEADGHEHRQWMLVARRPVREPPLARLDGAPDTPEGRFACGLPGTPDGLRSRPSPPDSAQIELAGTRVKICYSRPSARDRAIMGGLVPYGEPWRTGADEATRLRTDAPVRIGDIEIRPGWYSLYTIPGESAWTVAVNGLADRPGAPVDDWVVSHDVGRVTVPAEATGEHMEALTIRLARRGTEAAELILEWERTRIRLPIELAATAPQRRGRSGGR